MVLEVLVGEHGVIWKRVVCCTGVRRGFEVTGRVLEVFEVVLGYAL